MNAVAALVAGEELVSAVTGQRDRHPLARRPRHVIGGQGGGIREGLIEMPDEPREIGHGVRLDDEGVMLGAQCLRDGARVLELAVAALGEADTGGDHGPGGLPRHGGDDRGGVHAPAQEGSQGDVRHHPHLHGFVEEGGEGLRRRAGRGRPRGIEHHVPVLVQPGVTALETERVPS